MTTAIIAAQIGTHSCGCVGPQNGQPLCPCRMRSVKVVDGRYVQVIDHGPAASDNDARTYASSLSTNWVA